MAFRDPDEKRTGRAVERVTWSWLREIFLEDWGLKLLALAITLGLWYGVTSQRTPRTIRLQGVQLYFLRADDVEIANEPREEVEVTLQGPSSDVEELIGRRNLVATVDLSKYKMGEHVARLTPEIVSMNLPEGVRIEKIEPASVPLRLEQRLERQIEVEARLEGKTPEGYEVRGVEITPRQVVIRGPESQVNRMQRVLTETISLNGQRESLTFPQIAIDIAERKVVALDPAVRVHVSIGERRIERHFKGLAVQVSGDVRATARPALAGALIRGARSTIENLSPDKIKIVLEQSAGGAWQPRLLPPPGLEGQLELVATTPAEFSVNQ